MAFVIFNFMQQKKELLKLVGEKLNIPIYDIDKQHFNRLGINYLA